jgi:short-subunit dehydrogenase
MKRIFITGASSGIGEALARRWAGPDATLGLVARRRAVLDGLAGELRGRGATVHVYDADVADTAAMKSATASFLEAAGGVDLVVASAGVGIRSALLEGEVNEPARLMQVNVVGVINTVVPFLPAMVAARSGVLVAVASVAGWRALPGRTTYSASKAAVIAFMDGLRLELRVGKTGVHAMTVCPGFVKTPMTAAIKHKMPFLLDVEACADEIVNAIERREASWTFPWQLRLMRPLLRNGPDWLLRRLAPRPRTQGTL